MARAWHLLCVLGHAVSLHLPLPDDAGAGEHVLRLWQFQSVTHAQATASQLVEDRFQNFRCPGQHTYPATKVNRTQLTFIHIPRCAGTSIEGCTAGQPVGWGHESPALRGQHTWEHGRKCFRHHVPPTQVPEYYLGKETFCVVRNPYERLISEFHYPLVNSFDFYSKEHMCNKKGLNNFTLTALRWAKEKPWVHDCHLLPQTAFVHGWDDSQRKVMRNTTSCTHVIKQENLVHEFNTLMEEKGYNYRLTGEAAYGTKGDISDTCTPVSPQDFDRESLSLIHELWHDDFELLNYTMLRAPRAPPPAV